MLCGQKDETQTQTKKTYYINTETNKESVQEDIQLSGQDDLLGTV